MLLLAVRPILTTLVALAAGVASLPAQAQAQAQVLAQDARELELAREVVQLGYPEEGRAAAFGAAIDQIAGQMNQSLAPDLRAEPEVQQVLERFQRQILDTGKQVLAQHMDAMLEGMAQGYVAEFTLPELEAMRNYLQTPEGRGFFSRSLQVVGDPAYARASQVFLDDYMSRVPALRDEFVAELTAVLKRRQDRPRGT